MFPGIAEAPAEAPKKEEEKELKSSDHKILSSIPATHTGKDFLEALRKKEVTLDEKILDGAQAWLIGATWDGQQYLITLPKVFDSNLNNLNAQEQLREMLMRPKFQNRHLIQFMPLTNTTTSKDIISEIKAIIELRPHAPDDKLKQIFLTWYQLLTRIDLEIELSEGNRSIAPEKKQQEIKISKQRKHHLELIGISKRVPGHELAAECKGLTLGIDAASINQALFLFKQIVAADIRILTLFEGAHGDISDRNVLIYRDEESEPTATLIDIGALIKSINGKAITAADTDLGAPCYAAPELLAGDGRITVEVEKLDAWALGVILLQLVFKIPNPYIFDILKGFPEEKKPDQILREKYRKILDASFDNEHKAFHDTSPRAIEEKLFKALQLDYEKDWPAGMSTQITQIKTILTNALKVNPQFRFNVIDFIDELDYSDRELNELIGENLIIAIKLNNLMIIKKLWGKLKKTKADLLIDDSPNLLDILNVLQSCEDVITLGFVIEEVIQSRKLYNMLNTKKDSFPLCLFSILSVIFQRACLSRQDFFSFQSKILNTFLNKIAISKPEITAEWIKKFLDYIKTDLFYNHAIFAKIDENEKHAVLFRGKMFMDKAIKKNDFKMVNFIIRKVVTPENILNFIEIANAAGANESLLILIEYAITLFAYSDMNFLYYVAQERDPSSALFESIVQALYLIKEKYRKKISSPDKKSVTAMDQIKAGFEMIPFAKPVEQSLLHLLIKKKSFASSRLLFEDFQLDIINQPDKNGDTPLHFSVQHQQPFTLIFLLLSGADSKLKNKKRKSAADEVKELLNPTEIKVEEQKSSEAEAELKAEAKDRDPIKLKVMHQCLLCKEEKLSGSFLSDLFAPAKVSYKKIYDDHLVKIHPRDYLVYITHLKSYLLAFATEKINMGKARGLGSALKSSPIEQGLYERAQLIEIVMTQWVLLEQKSDQAPKQRCLACLGTIHELRAKFPESSLITQVVSLYDRLNTPPALMHDSAAALPS